jgi:hypothetical protein
MDSQHNGLGRRSFVIKVNSLSFQAAIRRATFSSTLSHSHDVLPHHIPKSTWTNQDGNL